MKEPTQEQIKEFWEWMGFRYVERTDLPGYWGWRDPRGYHAFGCLEIPDLNSLFKYAVPRLYYLVILSYQSSGVFVVYGVF